MTEETFLDALRDAPGDDATWAALADWLHDDGQSERAEMARLVRRLRTLPVMKITKARKTLESRLAELVRAGVRPAVPQIVNSIGIRLSLVPPGTFRMGSSSGERLRLPGGV